MLIACIMTGAIVYLITVRDKWPASVWHRYYDNPVYRLEKLDGWQDIPNLVYYWYTTPISVNEYLVRSHSSTWIASRYKYKYEWQEQPFRNPIQSYLPNIFFEPFVFIDHIYQCIWIIFWTWYSSLMFPNNWKNFD